MTNDDAKLVERDQLLKWHMGENLRWLAEQGERPGYMPCGMLTGVFLQTVADRLEALSRRAAGVREANQLCARVEADAVSALRYIEGRYGRLEGVGWDRVFDAHDELFTLGAALSPKEPS